MSGASIIRNKKISVLGLGRTGLSAALYLQKLGAKVLLSEANVNDPRKKLEAEKLSALGIQVELGTHSQALTFGELFVVSPGIAPATQIIQQITAMNKEIISDIELAARVSSIPIIAITGTNGKSTTCSLVSHILSKAGFHAPACGNYGSPILDHLEQSPDYLVVEVSSYQLHYCSNFSPLIGIWLNLTPDHLEWHGGLNAYIAAKQKLFSCQNSSHQFAILNQDDPIVASYRPAAKIFPFSVNSPLNDTECGAFITNDWLAYRLNGTTKTLCVKQELPILGKHNLENALAAISVAALLGIDTKQLADGLTSFAGLEHRLEYVASVDNIAFYNDSKATNPTSTIKALEAFPEQKIVLIAGGRDKGTSLSDLVAAAKKYASEIILLGEAKERFAQSFAEIAFKNVHLVNSLAEAVELGLRLKKGPVVLSPACASFDMFKDYEERGHVFKRLVKAKLDNMALSH